MLDLTIPHTKRIFQAWDDYSVAQLRGVEVRDWIIESGQGQQSIDSFQSGSCRIEACFERRNYPAFTLTRLVSHKDGNQLCSLADVEGCGVRGFELSRSPEGTISGYTYEGNMSSRRLKATPLNPDELNSRWAQVRLTLSNRAAV